MGRNQVEMFATLDGLISNDHLYRKFETIVDLAALSQPLCALYSAPGRPELGAERAFRMLVLQFSEDVSDREMERFMRENLAAKWFCGFGLSDKTRDHSFFGDFRKRLGMYGRHLFARCFSGLAFGYLHVCIRPFSEA